MMKLLPMLLLPLALPSLAAAYCERPASVDFEAHAGLSGSYDIVGRLPDRQKSYTGRVDISAGETAFILRRTVDGRTSLGEAWIERCSPDRFAVLRFSYPQASPPLRGSCFYRGNGDNYLLISCYTDIVGKQATRRGLEAMFQVEP